MKSKKSPAPPPAAVKPGAGVSSSSPNVRKSNVGASPSHVAVKTSAGTTPKASPKPSPLVAKATPSSSSTKRSDVRQSPKNASQGSFDRSSPKVVAPRRVVNQNVAAAVKSELFGWRAFLIQRVLLEENVDRLTFVNVTDVKVNMLLRQAERQNFYYCISGDSAVSLQRRPFFRGLDLDVKKVENELVRLLWKSGSCVTESSAAMLPNGAELMISPLIARPRIGRIKFVQLAAELDSVPSVVTIDCQQSAQTTEGFTDF